MTMNDVQRRQHMIELMDSFQIIINMTFKILQFLYELREKKKSANTVSTIMNHLIL